MSRQPKIERFNQYVLSKFHIYNSIFITLPFDEISNTGVLLPLFSEVCEKGFKAGLNPSEIVELFFKKYHENPTETEKISLLFKFIQYIERQVVLFDAIEDAAFPIVNNMDGRGTLRGAKEEAEAKEKTEELKKFLQKFKVRPVLTAHPTQFYPGSVLGIITDLAKAIEKDDMLKIKKLMAQLGKTPFFKKQKPTPYDEAVSLIWYLENVFYNAISNIYDYAQQNIYKGEFPENEIIDLGFWPGGDRDGNPFVTPQITLDVAQKLRLTLLKNYAKDFRKLKRRLTFVNLEQHIEKIDQLLQENIFQNQHQPTCSAQDLLDEFLQIRKIIVKQHQSMFIEELDNLINKIKIFGFYFATLDIRQDSRVHTKVVDVLATQFSKRNGHFFPDNFLDLNEEQRTEALFALKGKIDPETIEDEMAKKTIASIYAMKQIQALNGERGAHRYIISNCGSFLNLVETYTLIRLCDWENPSVDVIPLFETVDDLEVSGDVMGRLYAHPVFAAHLKRRQQKQVIMLGFSDGTKDGGYLMANWSIYKSKELLSKVSRSNDIKVVFFDGRGGPPARGGGKTHAFYASLGDSIENEEIQLTVQGQTISSNFGTPESCQYNLEQLISAGIANEIFKRDEDNLLEPDRQTINELAELSYESYKAFKAHPKFLSYLEKMSTLKYYAKTNIGSRPSKRNQSDTLNFADLRAIPFVGSWSQLKQNVPGFFGLGTAIHVFEQKGQLDRVKQLYQRSHFFRTLVDNSMMSMTKTNFDLTSYMKHDAEFGDFWQLIFDEFKESKRLLLEISQFTNLMQNHPDGKASIDAREKIVLPLLTIQQYALMQLQQLQKQPSKNAKSIEIYEKMVTRSLFGNINASRNSA
ncbi:MAG: phosphoenolpyruvate carboxylase [Bacteroidetes bacterium]|nr:phosphoenolpyruvate carboxylase [Bacteroidota bacterium]